MRLLPQSLAGQLTLFVLVALGLAQVAVFLLFAGERAEAVRDAYRENVIGRTVSVAKLVGELSPESLPQLLRAASSWRVRYWVAAEPAATETSEMRFAGFLSREIADALGKREEDVKVTIARVEDLEFDPFSLFGRSRHHDGEDDDESREEKRRHWRNRHWIAIAISTPAGWLNAVTGPPPEPPPFGRAFFISFGLSSFAVGLVVFFATRRIARPIRRLADGAEQMGRGAKPEPLAEDGPLEVRRTTRAFNEMRERIDRFVSDRTRMLAAISHDLRTPITSLRLRAELVEDEETRARLIDSIAELQEMTEAALAFARAEAQPEVSKPVDLASLVESLAADFEEMGKEVSFAAEMQPGRRALVLARMQVLKRAFRNLIDNAVTYGGATTVRLREAGDGYEVRIADNGPGLPEDQHELVFEPFVRGEASRSRDTGGIGLGLAIARDAVRGHGGDIRLEQTPGGGLTAVVTLPAAPPSRPA